MRLLWPFQRPTQERGEYLPKAIIGHEGAAISIIAVSVLLQPSLEPVAATLIWMRRPSACFFARRNFGSGWIDDDPHGTPGSVPLFRPPACPSREFSVDYRQIRSFRLGIRAQPWPSLPLASNPSGYRLPCRRTPQPPQNRTDYQRGTHRRLSEIFDSSAWPNSACRKAASLNR